MPIFYMEDKSVNHDHFIIQHQVSNEYNTSAYVYSNVQSLLNDRFRHERFKIFKLQTEQENFITNIGVNNDMFYIRNHKELIIEEINYLEMIDHDHPFMIAKGFNQTEFDVPKESYNTHLLLCNRGLEQDVEQILSIYKSIAYGDKYWELDKIKAVLIEHHPEKYGDQFLEEKEFLYLYGKYGTPEQKRRVLDILTTTPLNDVIATADYNIKSHFIDHKEANIRISALFQLPKGVISLEKCLTEKRPSVLMKLIPILTQDELTIITQNLGKYHKRTKNGLHYGVLHTLVTACAENKPQLLDKIKSWNHPKFENIIQERYDVSQL